MDRLEKAASTLREIAAAKAFTALIVIDDEDSEDEGTLSEALARDVLKTSVLCASLVPLREIARVYKPDIKIGKFSESSRTELNLWAMAWKILQGQEVRSDVPGMTLTGDFSDDAGPFFKEATLGSILVRPFELQVKAFGGEVCEIPCELYMKGFDIHPVFTDGQMTAAELSKNDSSVMLIRRYIEGVVRSKWSLAEANDIDAEIEVIEKK